MASKITKGKIRTNYQNDLVAERDDATKKLEDISAQIEHASFQDFGEKDKVLIQRQKEIMESYVGVLNARIAIS